MIKNELINEILEGLKINYDIIEDNKKIVYLVYNSKFDIILDNNNIILYNNCDDIKKDINNIEYLIYLLKRHDFIDEL